MTCFGVCACSCQPTHDGLGHNATVAMLHTYIHTFLHILGHMLKWHWTSASDCECTRYDLLHDIISELIIQNRIAVQTKPV